METTEAFVFLDTSVDGLGRGSYALETVAGRNNQSVFHAVSPLLAIARADFVNVVRFHFRLGCRFTVTANRTARKIVCKTSCFTSISLLATKIGACA